MISGWGSFVPPEIITNEDLVHSFNAYVERFNAENAAEIERGELAPLRTSSTEFIENASGIRQRHVVEKSGILDIERMRPQLKLRTPAELSYQAELGFKAAANALRQSGKSSADIGMLIATCSNYERPYPSVGIEIQQQLGSLGFAFDMNVACSSVPFAIRIARDALQAQPELNAALIVTPEFYTGHLNFRDRDSHFIFGDAAVALVMERESSVQTNVAFHVEDIDLQTQFSNNIRNDGGFLRPAMNRFDWNDPAGLFSQQGRTVFKEIVPLVSRQIGAQLTRCQVAPSEVRRLWLHQANSKMNQLLGKRALGRDLSTEELPLVLDRYANTGAAGVILAFAETASAMRSGEIGVMCAFGAGYSAGSVLLRRI